MWDYGSVGAILIDINAKPDKLMDGKKISMQKMKEALSEPLYKIDINNLSNE